MLFSQDRAELRRFYHETWKKVQSGVELEPLEKQVADIVEEHPEYHSLLSNIEKDFTPEDGQINPFLHMSMHLALREQVGTDRPRGIATVTRNLLLKHQDGHIVEHLMLDCLGDMLWSSQRNQSPPNEAAYLDCLKRL